MTPPLVYFLPVVVGLIGGIVLFALTSQRQNVNAHQRSRRQQYYHFDSHYEAPFDGTCTICLESYSWGPDCEKVKCGHVFHRDCYLRLLENSGPSPSCPNCMRPVF